MYCQRQSPHRIRKNYFQGYYFARPEIGRKKKLNAYRESRLKLVNMLNSENPEFDDISKLIEGDLSFSYEILRLVNSAYYGRILKLESIRYALVLLGLDEIKKWLYLAFISDLRHDKPEEIINISMLRAKFLENLSLCVNRRSFSSELLTIGMFSTIDLLLNMPMPDVLDEINFSDSIKDVLSGRDTSGFTARCYYIVLKYEKGEWEEARQAALSLGITASALNDAYICSLKWIKMLKMQ